MQIEKKSAASVGERGASLGRTTFQGTGIKLRRFHEGILTLSG
jgi:hypothetical protein